MKKSFMVLGMSVLLVLMGFTLIGCSRAGNTDKITKMEYKHISQEEAARIMANEKDIIIVDVRRLDEYASGHIPGAINIPNETIGSASIPQLPDKNRKILVYCRSGARSRQASSKLADMGYSNILEFGGIITWTGDIVTD